MKWALKDNERILATPKQKAVCPICNEEVIAKCGNINVWHWAHKNLQDCDEWYEPESIWHINWKNEFPRECQEVVVGNHRADIKLNKKYIIGTFAYDSDIVIELQNSTISSQDISKRERYYGNMIWLLNGETLAKNMELRGSGDYMTFRWKYPPKSWWIANKDIYIDLGNYVDFSRKSAEKFIKERYTVSSKYWDHLKKTQGKIIEKEINKIIKKLKESAILYNNKIFHLRKIYPNIPCGGWGYILTKEKFLEKLGIKKEEVIMKSGESKTII